MPVRTSPIFFGTGRISPIKSALDLAFNSPKQGLEGHIPDDQITSSGDSRGSYITDASRISPMRFFFTRLDSYIADFLIRISPTVRSYIADAGFRISPTHEAFGPPDIQGQSW